MPIPAGGTPLELTLRSGRLHAREFGEPGAPLAICLPGLTSNSLAFGAVGRRLSGAGRRAVAVDLRGRGRSEVTRPGTYGWPAHAADALAVADQLGDGPVDLVGHSMGAFVAMQAAASAPGRVRRVVLIDGAGRPERHAMPSILRAVERLGLVHPTAEAALAEIRRRGAVDPWTDDWERSYRHELESVPGGVRPRTDRDAVAEDMSYGARHDPRRLWRRLRVPVLLVRASRPLGRDGGFVVSASDRDRLLARVPGSRVVEVDANHYGVVMHPQTASAVLSFLEGEDAPGPDRSAPASG